MIDDMTDLVDLTVILTIAISNDNVTKSLRNEQPNISYVIPTHNTADNKLSVKIRL